MSEIEKMYMRCKIKKQQTCSHSDTCYNGSLNECEGCNSYQYPPFTAEKQVELIKWLIVHSPNTCLEDEIIVSAFEDSLANIINTMWQDLTEEEKQQIKNILEG